MGVAGESARQAPRGGKVLVFLMDSVKRKNLVRFTWLASKGYEYRVITTDDFGDSGQLAARHGVHVRVVDKRRPYRSFLAALRQELAEHRFQWAEVYPGTYLELLGTAIARLRGLRVCLIARGAEWRYLHKIYGRLERVAFRATYACASFVMYKEPYMKDFVERCVGPACAFVPNAVPVPAVASTVPAARTGSCGKRVVFAFANSFRTVRYPELVVEAFIDLCDDRRWGRDGPACLRLVGCLGDAADARTRAKEEAVKRLAAGRPDLPIEVHSWRADADVWLEDADVFVLPADVVFLNFALLEAMARGVTPIVDVAGGSEFVIEHGVEGLRVERTKEAWKAAMASLVDDAAGRKAMGARARQRVLSEYSEAAYVERVLQVYAKLAD